VSQVECSLAVFRIEFSASQVSSLPEFLGVFAQSIVGAFTGGFHMFHENDARRHDTRTAEAEYLSIPPLICATNSSTVTVCNGLIGRDKNSAEYLFIRRSFPFLWTLNLYVGLPSNAIIKASFTLLIGCCHGNVARPPNQNFLQRAAVIFRMSASLMPTIYTTIPTCQVDLFVSNEISQRYPKIYIFPCARNTAFFVDVFQSYSLGSL